MNCIQCHCEIDEMYPLNEGCNYPYIDVYEDIRFTYIDWLLNWKSDLEKDLNPLELAVQMNEKIDEVYWGLYKSEGDDGVFSYEIYLYLLKF